MPQPTAVPLDQVDLTDLDAFARGEDELERRRIETVELIGVSDRHVA